MLETCNLWQRPARLRRCRVIRLTTANLAAASVSPADAFAAVAAIQFDGWGSAVHAAVTNGSAIGRYREEFNRAATRFALLLAVAWLFAAFSYYLSQRTGADWFSRSGSVMCLIGAAVSFRVSGLYQCDLAAAFKEGLLSVPAEIEIALDPPKSYQAVTYLSYLTGIIGTGVWGYGDLLLHMLT
jgi:hypothetical protein